MWWTGAERMNDNKWLLVRHDGRWSTMSYGTSFVPTVALLLSRFANQSGKPNLWVPIGQTELDTIWFQLCRDHGLKSVLWKFKDIRAQISKGIQSDSQSTKRHANCVTLIEGSLEVKLPTIWTVEKQRWEESEEKRSEERRCRCAKRWESRETLCFSNDLWLLRVEK